MEGKEKKTLINPKSDDEQCFKWAVTAALHHENIKDHLERIIIMKTSVTGTSFC